MRKLGFLVPEGFTITTEACTHYIGSGELPEGLMDDVKSHMALVEEATDRGFGSSENPLLVSVRSGAPVSMPGMMDTVLNLGLNDEAVRDWLSAPETSVSPTTRTGASSRRSGR